MADAMKLAILDFDVEEYVDGYEFRGDEGAYMPTEKERFLITDAIHGVMSELSLAASPPAREEAPADLGGGDEFMVGPRGGMESREAPAEGAGLYNQGFSDGIAAQALRASNRTSEPEAGAVAWTLDFGMGVNPMTTFATKDKAAYYAKGCLAPTPAVVPLYRHPAPATADKLRVDEVISDDRDSLGDDRFIYRTTLMGERHIVDAASGFVWFKLPYDYRFTSNAGQLAQAKAFIAALYPKPALNEQPQ